MFSLPFRRSRRKSEPTTVGNEDDGNSLSRITSITSNISNKSRKSRGRRKSHSNIFSKRLSLFSNNSSDDLNSLGAASNTSDYETMELTRFKSLNYDKFNKELLQYLKFQGLSAPKILSDTNFIRISVSSTGENVFLPSIVNYNEDDVENLDLDQNNGNPTAAERNSSEGPTGEDEVDGAWQPTTLEEETHHGDHEEVIDEPVTHTFAIVISLTRPTSVSTITTQLQSNCKILWPEGLPSDRNVKSEVFELGQLSWDLNLSNYNYYVPFSADDEEGLDDDSFSELNLERYETGKFNTEPRIHPKRFQERSIDQIIRGPYANFKKETDPFIIGNLQNSGSVSFPPGDYVFTLPVLFPPHAAESLITQNAMVSYSLRTIVAQKNKVYNLGDYGINVIRGPPSNAISTADKPVYVNKIWNDALSYEISFPKKYVTVGSNIPIKMKLSPLIKDLSVRRIRVNVLEKITYCSKNLRYEFDEMTLTKHEGQRKTSTNEKILPLLELRTRMRTELALREEVMQNLVREDNLLSSSIKAESGHRDDVEVIGQLQILSYLPFIKPNKPNKELSLKGHNFLSTVFNQEKKTQINKNLQTRIQNQSFKVDLSTHFNESSGQGIFPDSTNNKFIEIHHKLQIAIRLSKKDESGKVHHYEVMIDTPIFFLNSACIPSNVDLPSYNEAARDTSPDPYFNTDQLPSFEEAISPMNSPSLVPYQGADEETINVLSRISTVASNGASQQLNWNYDNIDRVVTGTSDLQISGSGNSSGTGSGTDIIPRRRSTAANEMLSNLRRAATHDSYAAQNSSDGNVMNRGHSEEIHDESTSDGEEAPPPGYSEAIPLLSDSSDSSIESLSSLEDGAESHGYAVSPLHNESTDLTDQFSRSVYDQ